MLITCPTCASAYRIDPARVGTEGRSVRCAACRETWFLTPEDVIAARAADSDAADQVASDPVADAAWSEASAAVRAAETGEATPETPARRAAGRRKTPVAKRRPALALSPALAAGLAILAAVPLACLARAGVVRAVPQTAALYAAIGLPVNLRGIEIRDVVAHRTPGTDGDPSELVVEGDLVGVGRSDVPVPTLTVEIRDATGRSVRAFAAPAPRAVLGPGETARFRAILADPPAQGRGIELRFADAAPGKTRDIQAH